IETGHSGKVVNGENENGRVVNVYTTWLEGDWAVVRAADEFCSAINANRNIYLCNDIPFEADANTKSNWTAYSAEYDKTIEGNGYAVKDVVMTFSSYGAYDTRNRPAYCAMFKMLGSGAKLKDIAFENITLNIESAEKTRTWDTYCALLATEIEEGVTFEGVSLDGTFHIEHASSSIRRYNYGLVAAELDENASLSGLTYNVNLEHVYSGTDGTYTDHIDEFGLITFEFTALDE
ncbi:MAG: hypothetical protein K2M95_02900, partial [Clostridiales bacterium]|nr:hypothetical protein [Clostridiales bacterium]